MRDCSLKSSACERETRFCRIMAMSSLLLPLLSTQLAAAGRSEPGLFRLVQSPSVSSRAKSANAPSGSEQLQLSLEQAMWTALAFEDGPKLASLLKQGADPNKPEDLTQMTPLMAAETAPIAKILLDAGADPNRRDRAGRTPLHHAVKMREGASIVHLLVTAGASINARSEDTGQVTPLFSAIDNYIENKDRKEAALVIRVLAHLGAKLDATDATGNTVLAVAATNNQPELIRLLLELGADASRPLGDGRTPLDYARDAGAQDAVQALAAGPSKAIPAN